MSFESLAVIMIIWESNFSWYELKTNYDKKRPDYATQRYYKNIVHSGSIK